MDAPLPLSEPSTAGFSSPPVASQPPTASSYRDRSTGLIIFGIIQLILGGFALLFIPLMLLGAVMARKVGGGLPAGSYAVSVMTYALAAIALVTLGVGSIRARRWAWALNLVLSWIWLLIGISTTVLLTVLLPTSFVGAMRTASARRPDLPPMSNGIIAVVLTFIIAVGAIFLVALPIAFLVFYRKKDVEETCKHRDPVERWTDRCPLPVLAATLIFAWSAAHCAGAGPGTRLLPFFGRYLTGLPAAAGLLLLAVVNVILACSLFRRQVIGWWIATVGLVLQLVSTVTTFRHADLLQAYSKMGWSQEQVQMIGANPFFRSGAFLYLSLGFSVVFLGYMLWIKRYFPVAGASAAGESSSQASLS